MCERNSALGIVTMSNLQMRRSIASLRNCISNRMHPRYPESCKRRIPVASAYPTTSKPCMLSINSPEPTKPETTHSHIHRTIPDHLRHTNLAQMGSAAAPRSNSADLICDHIHIDHIQLAIPRSQRSSSCCCRCSSSTALSRVTQTTRSTPYSAVRSRNFYLSFLFLAQY